MFKELTGHAIMGFVLGATFIGVIIVAGLLAKAVLTSIGVCS